MVSKLVDRELEAAGLRAAQVSPPSLVVLSGRRRVGKSFLLAACLHGDRVISFQADEQGQGAQLELLASEASRVLLGAGGLAFADWDAAFAFLATQAAGAPITLILDEFQHCLAATPALDSIIQRHWDRWQRAGTAITLVLSGSALTLMEQLLDQGSPLYGRATYRPRLHPLDARDAAAFSASRSAEERVRRYGVLGGTPQYHVWAGRGPIDAAIGEQILRKDMPLYAEPLHLLREGEGIREPGTYLAILRAMAGGATRHNEIAQRAGISTPNLSLRLSRLEALGYVAARHPLAADGREQRSLWEIADPYFRFWFRYVHPNRSRLERGRVADVHDEVLADLDNLMGRVFEDVCREWVARTAPAEVVGSSQQVGRWWSRDGSVEIGIVGVRRGRYELLGSVKWRKVVPEAVLDQMYEHRAALGGAASGARLMLFARDGFSPALQRRASAEGVTLVTAARLFS